MTGPDNEAGRQATATSELFDQPPAPLRLFTFRYWDDAHRQWQTLDTGAVTRDDALHRARRFLRPRADRAARCGYRIAMPEEPSDMTLVMPRDAAHQTEGAGEPAEC